MSRGRLWEDRYRGSDNNRGNYDDCNCHCSSLVRYSLSALLGIFCLFREAANACLEKAKRKRERERERDGKKWKGKKEENVSVRRGMFEGKNWVVGMDGALKIGNKARGCSLDIPTNEHLDECASESASENRPKPR